MIGLRLEVDVVVVIVEPLTPAYGATPRLWPHNLAGHGMTSAFHTTETHFWRVGTTESDPERRNKEWRIMMEFLMNDLHRMDGRVTSNQLHELKNRLTVIKGMAQLLARQVRRADWERDRIIERVDGLQAEIGRLEAMIENLRDRGQSIGQDSTMTRERDTKPAD